MHWSCMFIYDLVITINVLSFLPGALMFLNEATLLNNLRIRYKKDLIYVSIILLKVQKLISPAPCVS